MKYGEVDPAYLVASNDDPEPSRKRGRFYTVSNGLGLEHIAQKFKVSEKELKKWNRISSSRQIGDGVVLIISQEGYELVKQSARDRASAYGNFIWASFASGFIGGLSITGGSPDKRITLAVAGGASITAGFSTFVWWASDTNSYNFWYYNVTDASILYGK